MKQLVPPVVVELTPLGLRWGDLAFGPVKQILISDRVRRAVNTWRLGGITRCDSVDVVKVRGRRKPHGAPPTYYLASIARSDAAIDELASGVVYAPEDQELTKCDVCRLGGVISRFERVVIESGTYPREDIFIARGLPGIILVTERFRQCCAEWGLSNCFLLPADEYSYDFESPV